MSFKPYYKWNTFNTKTHYLCTVEIITSFKPYYKWNTFNTKFDDVKVEDYYNAVLNLIINGIPSIRFKR